MQKVGQLKLELFRTKLVGSDSRPSCSLAVPFSWARIGSWAPLARIVS